MDATLGRAGADESVGEEDGLEDGKERKQQSDGSLALQQICALLRRNAINRRRTKVTSFCELCSPVLLLCVLVFGYTLSDVLVFPEEIYSSVNLDLPGGFAGLLPLARLYGQGLANATLPSVNSSLAGVTPGAAGGGDPNWEGEGVGGDGDEELLSFDDVKRVFGDVTDLMDGPFPVPDLDEFVGLGSAVAGDLGDGAYAQVVDSMESGWIFGNIITQGTLHFAPARDPAVGELVSWLSNTTKGFNVLTHRVHETEDDAVAYALDHLEERTWAVIALEEAVEGRVDYTIRMNFTVVPNTNTVVDMIAIGLDPSFQSYYLSGFLTLQTTLDRFMFKRALPGAHAGDQSEEGSGERFACVPPEVIGVPFPTAAYDQNLFYAAVGYLLGLAMTMSTMYPLSRLVKGVVEEKESRVRETMRIMGLRAWTHELSWLVTGTAVFTFIAVSVAALLSWTFLPLADGSLLLVFMLSFTLSEVGMALLVSSLFSKAKLASIAAPCVLFAGVLPRYIFYGSNRHEAPRSKTLASLLSPTAFTFGADFIADYEYANIGAGWGNYSEGEYSLRTSINMMFIDAILYGILAWYLDKVVPPEYGTSRDPLKFLTSLPQALLKWAASRWRRFSPASSHRWAPVNTTSNNDTEGDSSGVLLEEAGITEGVGVEGDPADFEPLGEGEGRGRKQQGVVIAGLRKEFGSKVAVAGLDLRLLAGDITCLLGHNGAGKSTTISMLTGQLGATSGDAVVWGHSVKDSLHKVRQNIGICPQHDALMPLLTAREHLEMYMDIKGMRQDLKGPLVTKNLREVGLLEKEHTRSSNLSGGQKRKLSVALALTGSPTLCILDEPTSGMDPYSRRFTWDLLRRGRAGRCTLLSTHFMEEAEHLGDRVAMLRKGKLRCVGSPLFLKSRFGLGYKLTLVKAGVPFDPDSLTSLVLSHVPNAEVLSSAGGEISFRLPREESGKFPGLFRDLEVGREAMGIGGYGVSMTSLEEVFLSLEREGKLADSGGGAGNAGFGGVFRGGPEEGGGETVSDSSKRNGSRRNGTNDAASMVPSGGSSSSGGSINSRSSAGGFQGAGELRQRRDSRKGGGGGGGAAAGAPSGKGKSSKSSAGERWGGTRTEQVREIEMHSLAAASRPAMPSNNLDVVGLTADARETANGADNGRSAVSVCNGRISTNRKQVNADTGRNGTSACTDRILTNGNPVSGSSSGSGSSSNKGGRTDESYNSSSCFAHDEEDRAALLAEGQEDHEAPPPNFAPNYQESDAAAGGGRRERNVEAEAAEVAGDRAPRQPWSNPLGWKGAASRFWEQLRWLLWKRKVVAARDWRGGVYQVVLPAALVALVLVLLTIDVGLAGPSLAMSAAMFGSPTEVLYVTGRGGGAGTKVANVAKATDEWTLLNADNEQSELSVPTSSGVSRFLLDTYDNIGEDEAAGLASASKAGGGETTRPPRYGAFVFGDRFPVNVTVDWDALRERPELLAESLEILSETLPTEGGEFDLKRLMEATGVDEHDLAQAVLGGSDGLKGRLNGQDGSDAFGFRLPQNNGTAADNGLGDFATGGNYSWVTSNNWTQGWFDLVDEDPTVRFTGAEYMPQSSELKLEGVVLSAVVNNQTQSMELGEVVLSVDDILDAVPPGTRHYDKGMLPAPNGTTATVMFNTTAPHSLPAWLGELTAKTFEACGKQRGLESEKMAYTTRSHPLPLTATESLEVQTMLSLLVSLLVTIPLCYAPAAFVTFLVRERACKSKRVQLVSGASPLAYWLSSYLWDAILFFMLTVLVMLAFAAYGADASKVFMMHWDALLGTWALLISYGLSALPLSYLYSFAFDGPSSAQISITGVNFLSGFGFVIAYAVLASLKKTVRFAEKAQHFFRLFPPYLLGDGLIKVSSEFYLREVLGMDREWGVLAWDVAGKAICYMCLEAVGYLTLVLLVEYSLAAGVRSKADRLRLRFGGWSDGDLAKMLAASKGPSEDSDVKEERLRVDEAMARAREGSRGGVAPAGVGGAGGVEADTVLIRGLTKVYPAPMSSAQQRPKCAVRGLSLGIKRGECFGLLGINGAGKSTTLQILTRDLQATSGNLRVEGKPITSSAMSRLLGYCPQMDPLLPLMTVKETLLFFGGLKAIDSQRPRRLPQATAAGACIGGAALQTEVLQRAATTALSAVSLGSMENQLAGTLSGGNKRKLSLAVALIGGPPVLLLDEPSSGMDPGARRSMWEVISSLSASHSVILTTHSMEECEAVCDRLGIMVGGRLRCLGTSQHLKGRFGGGYSIEVRCPTASMPQVSDMIRGLSPLARLEEMHPTLAKFSIPAGGEMTIDSLDAGRSGSGRLVGDERHRSGEGVNGLSLWKAFETIEARKAELEVWDYSISQATLETIFMSFAKNQEEEVASVPGVTYTDTTSLNDANQDMPTPGGTGRNNNTQDTRSDARRGTQGRPPAPTMDVEMGWMGESRSRREKSSNEPLEDEGESTTFV